MSSYDNLLIYQYKKKPKAKATINAIMTEVDVVLANIEDLKNQWDIDVARKQSLDIIGRRVGVSRVLPAFVSKGYFGYLTTIGALGWGQGVWYRYGESTGESLTLNDDDFRFLIKAKILKNFQNGTFDYTLDSMQSLLSDEVNIIDNMDWTVTVMLPQVGLSPLQVYMIEQMDILPRPMCVDYIFKTINKRIFGFKGFDNYGFGVGRFINT